MASNLREFIFKKFDGGYNSYPASKSMVKDNEFPATSKTSNVLPDDNGSVTKRPGNIIWSAKLSTGHAITGMDWFSNGNVDAVIASSGSQWWNCQSGIAIPLTGKVFTPDLQNHFTQALGVLFGSNARENLCYTTDGTTINEVTVNTNVGPWPVFFNGRIYMLSTQFPDRVYFSNTYQFTNPSAGGGVQSTTVISGFDYANMFNTNLTINPKLNAGFAVFEPGSGIKITRLYKETNSVLYVFTERHGIWTMTPGAINTDGTVAHIVSQVVVGIGSPAGRSVVKVAQNDQYFYGADSVYSRGEVQYYASPRVTNQTGRIKHEMESLSELAKPNVAIVYFKNKVYISYQTGSSRNDTIIVQDKILNAWSPPWTGANANCFLNFHNQLLYGSSDPLNPYIYQMGVGTDDGGVPISSSFETKSTDCGHPGIVKQIYLIEVFYGLLQGYLYYEVIADETLIIDRGVQLTGGSVGGSSGVGSQLVGTFLVGAEFTPGATLSQTTSTNGSFRIKCKGDRKFKRISVRFYNANLGDQFKVSSVICRYKLGSVYQK